MGKYTVENIKNIPNGNIQFNVTSGKQFRDAMAKWHIAKGEIADAIKHTSANIESYTNLIASTQVKMQNIADGKVLATAKTIEELKADISAYERSIESERTELKKARDIQKKRFEDAETYFTETLYNAYSSYIMNRADETKYNNYIVALANFFEDAGFTPCMDTLVSFTGIVGEDKNRTNEFIKSGGVHNRAYKVKQWRELVMGNMADRLITENIIAPHKFTYVFKDKKSK